MKHTETKSCLTISTIITRDSGSVAKHESLCSVTEPDFLAVQLNDIVGESSKWLHLWLHIV